MTKDIVEGIVSQIPLGRVGEPSDIGGTALFLTSNEGKWITGQIIVLDGGMLVDSWSKM